MATPTASGSPAKLAAPKAAVGRVCGSGMASLSAAFLGLLTTGDSVVASHRLYGRTTKLLREELHRFGVKTIVVDVSDLDATQTAVRS